MLWKKIDEDCVTNISATSLGMCAVASSTNEKL